MPEVLSKHSGITLQILKDAGIKCGAGSKQQILIHCPKDQFCALPTGELCVYGLNDISNMTQISSSDLSEALTGIPTMLSPVNVMFMLITNHICIRISNRSSTFFTQEKRRLDFNPCCSPGVRVAIPMPRNTSSPAIAAIWFFSFF